MNEVKVKPRVKPVVITGLILVVMIGVCMGNGADETKQAADYITGHIDENGLYDAFVHFGLTGE